MGSRNLLIVSILLVLGLAPGQWSVQTLAQAPAQRLYVLEFTVGPAWAPDKPPHEQAYFKEHSENLRRLRTEGRLVLGARYSDKGLVVLKAADEAEARAAAEADPSVKAGTFRYTVFEFRPFYDGCVEKPAPAPR